ncbi:hypothetical protein HYU19_05845 [Candidatus Woesearchaeota archaeon]|nr:hypothetical protein [Candidatus Woesearchaeota archaeon]
MIKEAGEKRSLLSFFGKWPGKKEELDTIKKELEIDRKAKQLPLSL